MSNYTKDNLVAIAKEDVPVGSLAIKVNGECFPLTIGGTANGAVEVTLGQLNSDLNFQPLKFDGTEAVADGDPITSDKFYVWDGVYDVQINNFKNYFECVSVYPNGYYTVVKNTDIMDECVGNYLPVDDIPDALPSSALSVHKLKDSDIYMWRQATDAIVMEYYIGGISDTGVEVYYECAGTSATEYPESGWHTPDSPGTTYSMVEKKNGIRWSGTSIQWDNGSKSYVTKDLVDDLTCAAGNTPEVGKIYNYDATAEISKLYNYQ